MSGPSERRFLDALSRIMLVATPEDVAAIVENANAAVDAEREACATLAESMDDAIEFSGTAPGCLVAAAIRARG